MDKLYRPIFLRELNRLVAEKLSDFTEYRVPRDHQLHEIFAGSLLFSRSVRPGRTAWLWWVPGPGVERDFDVLLGWSQGPEFLPHQGEHDSHIYSLLGPAPEYPAAAIHLQQIVGQAAIGGFTIPTPWDQLLTVKVTAPKHEHNEAMRKAYAEALALTEEQRTEAVRTCLESVFAILLAALPAFISTLYSTQSDA